MLLGPLPMVYVFHSLFVLQECVHMLMTSIELKMRLAPWNRFKPFSKIVLLTVPRRYFFCGSFMLFLSCVCYAFVRVCLLIPSGYLLGKGWPLGSRLWSTQLRFATLLSSLIARRWVGLQTIWWFRLKDLSIDKMVGVWCFGCLSGQPEITCWILLTVESLSLLYLFLYLDLYVLGDDTLIS